MPLTHSPGRRHRLLTASLTFSLLTASALAAVPAQAAPAAPPPTPPAADGVQVGAGSYAAEPPPTISSYADVQQTLNQHLYIDPSQAGKPVPTNQWWTDLVVSRYSGDLWAYPLVSSNSADGTKVSYPRTWNTDGTAMTLESPVTVSGVVTPEPDPSDRVLADFESGIPQGWTSTGTAFSTTSAGTASGQSPVSGWLGKGFLNSFTNEAGDGATGSLSSPEFTIDRKALVFKVGGGNHPGQEEVRLVVDGQSVLAATGENSEQLRWVSWDLSPFAGKKAHLELVDQLQAGWAHIMVDHLMLTDAPDKVENRFSTDFHADRADALRWGDWNVSWRMPQTGAEARHIDVTALRGSPYEWFEFTGVTPALKLSPGAQLLDADGNALNFPVTTDRFQIRQDGHNFGVHAPSSTTFDRSGDTLTASAGTKYLVLSALADTGLTLNDLARTAFAIPRDSRMSYDYDPVAGKVNQHWNITTQALEGSNLDTVQGWLQHQYEETGNNLSFTPATYQTPRGLMKTTVGHGGWDLSYTFTGISPIAPEPLAGQGENAPYQAEIMRKYVNDYAQRTTYGGDTYWGGKDLLQLGEYMLVARQLGEKDAASRLQATLTAALTDWYTYTDGEKEHFFARYPQWKALIGFGDSYGSAQFNDNHFHYGYFTAASAMLAMVDPDWAKKYQGMATLVSKEYANSDREDADFPYLRTFGIWDGRSSAGGFSSPGGNNQESSSEAIQSEAGLFLLGTALGDKQMQATGAMQYVTERATVRDYYQNAHGNKASASFNGNGVFPPSYQHDQVGIMFDSGQAYATYFSGDPAWIYGIQWMPTAPWFNFLGWDPDFSKSIMQTMMKDRPGNVARGATVDGAGAHVQMLTKKWYGIGTYGDIRITQDRAAAIGELQDMIRAAELHHPGYVSQKTASNPLYNSATDTLYVQADGKGGVTFPAQYWTPETLPAALVPAERSSAEADKDPKTWSPASPLLAFFTSEYTLDDAAAAQRYAADLTHYTPGRDTAQAAGVFSGMGDALGNVVLGFLAQYDPATYADIHKALWDAKDPAVTGQSMAGLVYHQAMSNRTLGTEVTTRHTSSPLSQVYRNAAGVYTYVIYNPGSTQETYQVFDGARQIGEISVPAGTQIASHLDARLDRITLSIPDGVRTVTPGTPVQLTATGYDQYGATLPLNSLSWSTTAGTVSASGVFTSAARAPEVVVTAALGGVKGSVSFRVDEAPRLSDLSVTPGFQRVVVGQPAVFSAAGVDQYGDPFPLSGSLTWTYTGAQINGASSAASLTPSSDSRRATLTATSPGAGRLEVTTGSVSGAAVIAAVSSIPDAARGASVTATSTLGANTPDLVTDGNKDTRWESQHGIDPVDLTVDLGRSTDIDSLHAVWEGAAARTYTVQLADSADGPWKDLTPVTKTTAAPDDLSIHQTARFVRLHMTSRLTDYGYSLYDLQIFGTPAAATITPAVVLLNPRAATVAPGSTTQVAAYAFDGAGAGGILNPQWSADTGSITSDGKFTAPASAGATSTVTATLGSLTATAGFTTAGATGSAAPVTLKNVALGHPTQTSSNERGDLDGDAAVDGKSDTRWSSSAADGQWISVDLGKVTSLDAVEIDWERAFARTYRIQVRNSDSEQWCTVLNVTDGREGTLHHDLKDVSAAQVRIIGDSRATQYGISLWELRVLANS